VSVKPSIPSMRPPAVASPAAQRATDLLRAGKPNAAISVLREAIEHSAGDWRLHNELGDALLAARRDEEAIAAFMTVHRLNPTLGSVCVKIGRFYLARQLTKPALTWLRYALEVDTGGMEALTSLAAAEAQFGHREQAVSLLDAWVAADPEDPARPHLAMAILGETTPASAPQAYVSRLFDNYAESFDDSLGKLHYCGPELIAELLKRCVRQPWLDGAVLDAGCGTGLVGAALRSLTGRLVGVDLSQNMLREAAHRRVYDELIHAEMSAFMVSRPGQFDAVTASDVLTYVGDLGPFCAAAQAALRPGGLLIAVLEEMAGGSGLSGYHLNSSARFSHSEQYVRQCLHERGFVVRAVSRTPMRIEYGRPTLTLVVTAEIAD
jgi:predicted TPR repeat methyltransferase